MSARSRTLAQGDATPAAAWLTLFTVPAAKVVVVRSAIAYAVGAGGATYFRSTAGSEESYLRKWAAANDVVESAYPVWWVLEAGATFQINGPALTTYYLHVSGVVLDA